MSNAKSFEIPKRLFVEAFQKVKANGGSSGVDGESLEAFEANLKGNLYRIWNRMSSGSYHPPAVRTVMIPKRSGGQRPLGIPTVGDRVAQSVVRMLLEPRMEKLFHSDSYGFRPGRSALDAVEITRKRCWQYEWVVEFDIVAAFDSIRHDLMLKAIEKHVPERWIKLYLERWLKAPCVGSDGEHRERVRGTPQGGCISPLLMNLYMHYAFDAWMARSFAECPFARYADDAVIHCRSEEEARAMLAALDERLKDCGLELHPAKTRIVYCKDSNRRGKYPNITFTFLGFEFRPRKAANKSGELFTSFCPGVSAKARNEMRRTIGSWKLGRRTSQSIEELSASLNPILTGWMNYYGRFYRSALFQVFRHFDKALSRWIRRKYSNLWKHKTRAFDWMARVRKRRPNLFVHWRTWPLSTTR